MNDPGLSPSVLRLSVMASIKLRPHEKLRLCHLIGQKTLEQHESAEKNKAEEESTQLEWCSVVRNSPIFISARMFATRPCSNITVYSR